MKSKKDSEDQAGLFNINEVNIPLVKKCYIIAGPNGAGKTTFANEYLPIEAECLNFINVDLIAHGLSPFKPERMAMEAGRLMLRQIEDSARKGESFAFETTLSGKGYAHKIRNWKKKGYKVILYYLRLRSVELAIERVRIRALQGGHDIPEKDIRRRYDRSLKNLGGIYKSLVDEWTVYDNSEEKPTIIDNSEVRS